MLNFASDYNIGAHECVLKRLVETNFERTASYGTDEYSHAAEEKIKALASSPNARVYFLTGGTQTNAVALSSILRGYQGVVSAVSGHIATHEAGAIEYTGHKVIELPHTDGKISAENLSLCFDSYYSDENREHTVMPGAVYISHPTEYGTLYSLDELRSISQICRKNGAYLYLDGARLGYALAADTNDVSLSDIAELCDLFYIGGTKVGALFGEALVVTRPELCPCFTSTVKQHGALFAKGRLIGVQFDALFTDNAYVSIARHAVERAMELRAALEGIGVKMYIDSHTNQQFAILPDDVIEKIRADVALTMWERYDESSSVVRFVTSFATESREVCELVSIIRKYMQ